MAMPAAVRRAGEAVADEHRGRTARGSPSCWANSLPSPLTLGWPWPSIVHSIVLLVEHHGKRTREHRELGGYALAQLGEVYSESARPVLAEHVSRRSPIGSFRNRNTRMPEPRCLAVGLFLAARPPPRSRACVRAQVRAGTLFFRQLVINISSLKRCDGGERFRPTLETHSRNY